jgi:hypothetical protein
VGSARRECVAGSSGGSGRFDIFGDESEETAGTLS